MNMNVTGQVQEIVNRAGWSYGNMMGFKFYDNGSPANVRAYDDPDIGSDSKLTITYGGGATLNFRVIIFKDKIN